MNKKRINKQEWEIPQYSKREINNAGNIIRKENHTEEEYNDALKVIDNWRASHAYPLHIIYMYLQRMSAKSRIVVAQRIKRLDSIVGKLKRENGMELWRMQDLGGCRFIVEDINDVYYYSDMYRNSNVKHEFKREYDYIKRPKPSGYRSLHLVYKFHSDAYGEWNKNILIEIQFRTHLQHLWATALETMGIYINQALKAGEGDEYIKRFFVLVSSLFAIKEKCPVVPETSEDINELISEIEKIDEKYRILKKLSAIRKYALYDEKAKNEYIFKPDEKGYYVLTLNYNDMKLVINYFSPSKIDEANTFYINKEKEKSNSDIDVVLVRVSSFTELQKAYPNYFADIKEFISIVKTYFKKVKGAE